MRIGVDTGNESLGSIIERMGVLAPLSGCRSFYWLIGGVGDSTSGLSNPDQVQGFSKGGTGFDKVFGRFVHCRKKPALIKSQAP